MGSFAVYVNCAAVCGQEVHNKIREQFRNMPDEFMTSTVAATSKVSPICQLELCRKFAYFETSLFFYCQ